MKSLKEYIVESQKGDLHQHNTKLKLRKGLTDEEKEFFTMLRKDDRHNNYRSMEDMENALWKLSDEELDQKFQMVADTLDRVLGYTTTDVTNKYALARSGKENKVNVIAQVAFFAGA